MKALTFALTLAAAPALAADADLAGVKTTVAAIPMAVDLGAYALAETLFAPEVTIDYTSLWGGDANTMTPPELMAAWRGIVPGFDATWHELGPVTAAIDGDIATATAFVDGRHWIGTELWRPIGTYDWTLTRAGDAWQVTSMTFTLTGEIGDRALAAQAMDRAAQ